MPPNLGNQNPTVTFCRVASAVFSPGISLSLWETLRVACFHKVVREACLRHALAFANGMASLLRLRQRFERVRERRLGFPQISNWRWALPSNTF
ncbi:hypothetical protein [Nostoc sp.]|uniref:hypothetical protein n=1 Tax=Nostoc sp. TaxID=1180 RepID=UPI002FF6D025